MNKELVHFLGFNRYEERVWNALGREMSISAASRLTKIPRTSLYTAIRTLKKRGLLESRRQGKETILRRASNDTVCSLFKKGATQFSTPGTLEVPVNEQTGFTIFHGKKSLFNVWKSMAAENKGQRVAGIQPTPSMVSVVKKFSPKDFIKLNNEIKNQKLIVEVVLREDFFPVYMQLLGNDTRAKREMLKSFLGRMTDMVFVPSEYLNNKSDLLLIKDTALLLNWETETAIKIQNTEMVNLLKELYELARGYGKKINMTNYLTTMLAKLP